MTTTISATGTTIQDLMTRSLLTIWNERDRARRLAVMTDVYDSAVVLHEPEEVLHGHEAVDGAVQRVLDGAPGWVFAPVGAPVVNDNLGRLEWQLGPEDGPPVVTGADIALVSKGKIEHLYVHVNAPAPEA